MNLNSHSKFTLSFLAKVN